MDALPLLFKFSHFKNTRLLEILGIQFTKTQGPKVLISRTGLACGALPITVVLEINGVDHSINSIVQGKSTKPYRLIQ